MEIKIEKFENDKHKTYLAFCFEVNGVVSKVFADQITFVNLLDLKPSEIASLPVGTIKVFKEVK